LWISEQAGITRSSTAKQIEELRFSGLFRSKQLQFRTDISGKPIGPTFKGQKT
jgi:hypothetical protein